MAQSQRRHALHLRVDLTVVEDGVLHLGYTAWRGEEIIAMCTGYLGRGLTDATLYDSIGRALREEVLPDLWADSRSRGFEALLRRDS